MWLRFRGNNAQQSQFGVFCFLWSLNTGLTKEKIHQKSKRELIDDDEDDNNDDDDDGCGFVQRSGPGLFLLLLGCCFVLVGDQAVVLESYQLYSKSAPLCKEERRGEEEWRRGGDGEEEEMEEEEMEEWEEEEWRGGDGREEWREGDGGGGAERRWSRGGDGEEGGGVKEKRQDGSARLSNVPIAFQSDSSATLVVLKVGAVLPSDTGISGRGLGAVTEALKVGGEGRGKGWFCSSTPTYTAPPTQGGRAEGGGGHTETQTGVCCVHVWWTDDETRQRCMRVGVSACWRACCCCCCWGGGWKRGVGGGHVCTHASGPTC